MIPLVVLGVGLAVFSGLRAHCAWRALEDFEDEIIERLKENEVQDNI